MRIMLFVLWKVRTEKSIPDFALKAAAAFLTYVLKELRH